MNSSQRQVLICEKERGDLGPLLQSLMFHPLDVGGGTPSVMFHHLDIGGETPSLSLLQAHNNSKR